MPAICALNPSPSGALKQLTFFTARKSLTLVNNARNPSPHYNTLKIIHYFTLDWNIIHLSKIVHYIWKLHMAVHTEHKAYPWK